MSQCNALKVSYFVTQGACFPSFSGPSIFGVLNELETKQNVRSRVNNS